MRTYTRHQLKQDAFTESFKEQVSWVVHHQRKMVVGGVIVAAALAIGLGGWAYLQHRNDRAGVALGIAMGTYDAPLRPAGAPATSEMLSFSSAGERARAAHNEFQKVADQYSHTRSGAIARYFAALTALDTGDAAGGEKELKAVAESGNEDLAALAKLALAARYRDSNRVNDAVSLYKELIEHPTRTVSKSTAQLELAATYKTANQPLDAAKLYEEIMKENPSGPAAQIATRQSR